MPKYNIGDKVFISSVMGEKYYYIFKIRSIDKAGYGLDCLWCSGANGYPLDQFPGFGSFNIIDELATLVTDEELIKRIYV